MDNITKALIIIPVVLFSVVAHEVAHGWVALRNGDTTAYALGRLTFNPIKHIDPVMTIILPCILLFIGMPILAGAKPVPVNPRNYRHYKRGDIEVSLAGVTVNVLIALACTLLMPVVYGIGRVLPGVIDAAAVLQQMLLFGIIINLQLAAFNLLPIPPLDGSHVFKYLLPPGWALSYARFGRFGLIALYALLMFGGSILLLWLTPAFALSDLLTGLVRQFIYPWPFPLS